ncbi:MAG: hypothetical protein OSJ65_00015 [Bacilli bacterium]|nr:hypothetical protein [Bacilli bacterium]
MEKSFSGLKNDETSKKKLLFFVQNTGDFANLEDKRELSIIEAVKNSVSEDAEPAKNDEEILKELGDFISKSTGEDDEFEELEELEDLPSMEFEELPELEDLEELGDVDATFFDEISSEKKGSIKTDVNNSFSSNLHEINNSTEELKNQEILKASTELEDLELLFLDEFLNDSFRLDFQSNDLDKTKTSKKVEKKEKKKNICKKRQKKVIPKRAKRVKKSRPAKKKKSKVVLISAISLAVAVTALASKYGYNKYQEKNKVSIVYDVGDNKEDVLEDNFNSVIESNLSIGDKLKLELEEYLKILYRYDLSIETYELILSNIKKYDFSNNDSVNIQTLTVIFDGNKNAPLIADQLYNYKNNITKSSNKKFQLLSNVLSFSDSAIINLLEGKDLNTILKLVFDIDDNIDLTTTQISADDGKNTSVFLDKLKEISFGNITQTCEVENNIFAQYIKIYENKIGCYLYFDKDTKKGVNEKVYKEELDVYLMQRENSLDYNKLEDRELLYLYVNALLDSNNLNNNDMSDLIMNGTLSKFGVYDIYDLMKYLSGNGIDHKKSVYLYSLIMYGDEALPLLQEVNMCLKRDLDEGLISQEEYDSFMNQLSLGIELYAPNMKDEFEEANKKNESMKELRLDFFGTNSI